MITKLLDRWASMCILGMTTSALTGCVSLPLAKLNPVAVAPTVCKGTERSLIGEPATWLYVGSGKGNTVNFVTSKGSYKTFFQAYSAQTDDAISGDLPSSIAHHPVVKKLQNYLLAASAQAQLNSAKSSPTRHMLGLNEREEQQAISASAANTRISDREIKDFAQKLFSTHLRANPGAFMRSSPFIESDRVGSSDSEQAHDGMFYAYIAAYYQNKFVDRMGVSVAAPTISQTITDAEITAAETILLEYLFDKIDKTPVLGHTAGGSITFYPGGKTSPPTVYTVLHPTVPAVYLEIGDGTDNACGFNTKNAWVLNEIANAAGDQGGAVGGLIANTAGGISIGLGVVGKISIGDNQTLSVLAKTFASRLATRAAFDATFWTLKDVSFTIPEPGS